MRTRRTLIVWGTAGLVLAVMALAIWWGGATAPSTSAQAPNDPPGASTPTSEPTPAPPLITLPAIEPDAPDQVIVSTPWEPLGSGQ